MRIRTIASGLLSTFIALLVLMVVLEVGLRVFDPQPVGNARFEDLLGMVPSRTRGGLVEDLVPGRVVRQWGAEVRINRYGSRDYDYSDEKPPGVFRIAVLGDSVMFGWGVSLEETFSKVLERDLNSRAGTPPVQVLMFGRPGEDVRSALYYLEEKALPRHPDLVIFAMILNDFVRPIPPTNGSPAASGSKKRSWRRIWLGRLRAANLWIKGHSHLGYFVLSRLHILAIKEGWLDLRSLRALEALWPSGPEFKRMWPPTQEAILALKKRCDVARVPFMIVIFPYDMQLSPERAQRYRRMGLAFKGRVASHRAQQLVGEFCAAHAIPFLDLWSAFAAHAERDLYLLSIPDYGHPNALGHRVAAEALRDFLIARGLVPGERAGKQAPARARTDR